MAKQSLTDRMEDYFARQMASLERLKADLRRVEHTLSDPEALRSHLTLREKHASETQALQDEFHALHREWQAAARLPIGERDAVRVLAGQAEALARDVSKAYDDLAVRAKAEADVVTESLAVLRRSRSLLAKYSGKRTREPSFLDRKA